METMKKFDNPSDCQSTTTGTILIDTGNKKKSLKFENQINNTLTTTNAAATNKTTTQSKATSPTPAATSKLKSQQQQQQQQHQFRAPQQFVKHKKSSSATTTVPANSSLNYNKKNKFGNKRQHRTGKQNVSNATAGPNNAGGMVVNDSSASTMPMAVEATADNEEIKKGDLENIQNLKNQTGGHYHHQQSHHHHHQHQHQHHQHSHNQHNNHYHGSGDITTAATCLAAMASEKLGYGHGHGKQTQQLHKKPLPSHRCGGIGGGGVSGVGGPGGLGNAVAVVNHHHILCAGSAVNSLGAGVAGPVNNNGPVSASNLTCCHINGCSSHNAKDNNSSNNSVGSVVGASALHICCLRSKFFLPDKRPRKGNFIPPTKFLLGGNISDPLNLSSLQNEASNNSSTNNTPATTPRQSPITTPPKVEVIIPPNIHDPLHLLDPVDSMEYEKQLTSPMKRGLGGLSSSLILGLRGMQNKSHKHRYRKNRKPKRRRFDSFNSTCSVATTIDSQDDQRVIEKQNRQTVAAAVDLDDVTHMQDSQIGGYSRAVSENEEEEFAENLLPSPQNKQHQHLPANIAINRENTETTAICNLNANTVLNAAESAPQINTASEETLKMSLKDQPQLLNSQRQMLTENKELMAKDAAIDLTVARERVCRDLRLDLINTTSTSIDSNAVVAATVGISGASIASGISGRKRKVSESTNSQKGKKHFRMDSMDKIVSPVVPQPGAWKRPPRTTATGARKSQRRSTSTSETTLNDLSPIEENNSKFLAEEIARDDTPELNKVELFSDANVGVAVGSPLSTASGATSINTVDPELETAGGDTKNALILAEQVKKEIISSSSHISERSQQPKFPADGKKYCYGNYDRYAGLRNLNEFMDIRLQVFLQYPELFKNKDILDIGCNVGHMTISVARKLAPKSILGIDIDKELIARARRNLAMYVRIPLEVLKKEQSGDMQETVEGKANNELMTKKGRRRRRKKRHHQQQLQAQQHRGHNHHQHHINHWQQHHFLHHHLLHHHHHHHHVHHHHLHLQQENSNVDAADFFPISFPLSYGGIAASSLQPNQTPKASSSPQNLESQSPASTSTTTRSTPGHPAASSNSHKANTATYSTSSLHRHQQTFEKNDFPANVFFRQSNYVLKDESLLANDTQQYDLILCLSITKWIHLNFGDNGLKLAFKRMFNQLRPGGKLILEAQNWASYKKKKNLTENIYYNYHNIEFFPNKFHEYLLSSEVGFSHSYTLGIPKHLSKGFSRPIQLYAKGDYTPNHVRWSDAYYPQTPFEAYRGIYATMPPRPTGMQSSYPVISSTRSQNYDTPLYMGGGGASGPYSCRQTPMHQPSTSQYYNPLESDSYQPSYDMEYLNHMYVFASPLYQTVWSPPTSMRKSSSHTPAFGSVRDAEFEGDGNIMSGGSYHRHVYPPNDDTSSPNANAINAFNSIRDPDTDDSNQQRPHVYATNCVAGESATSPHPNLSASDAENLDESLMLDDERCDLSEA